MTESVGERRSSKRAHGVVRAIERDITERGWPVGAVLGSEPGLIARYGVSRAILREAIRVLEHHGVVRTRRGPGGGIVVNTPAADAIAVGAARYLEFAGVSARELVEARLVLEELTVSRAVGQVGEADVAVLRAALDQHPDAVDEAGGFHLAVAEVSGNPTYGIFIDTLARMTRDFAPRPEDVDEHERTAIAAEVHRAHEAIVEAVLSGDVGRADHRMRRHLEATHAWIEDPVHRERRASPGSRLRLAGDPVERGATTVAEAITSDIADGGLTPGDLLGSEAELIARHGVGRAVFREAVRLLEYYSIVRTRRGPGGGIYVTSPDPRAAATSLALYLDYLGVPPEVLHETRTELELRVVQLAAARGDPDGIARLRERLAVEAGHDASAWARHDNIHPLIGELSGNRALSLVLSAVTRAVLRHYDTSAVPGEELAASTYAEHVGIVEAIEAGDTAVARARLQQHLEGQRRHLRGGVAGPAGTG